ncbi:ABC transporter permease [Roseiarcaceae bacterium H3SJ34-1]|uniref:ABC transporter permease n=1 Tax=Terripilifer ovatus TaxID=3032367 RepID=UPI003AB92244|nr:ABC transporter permease [Roseiarcaceae bacterium H3SJ34-1]
MTAVSVNRAESVLHNALAFEVRASKLTRWRLQAWRFGLLAVLLVAWQVLANHGLDPFFFSSPQAIGNALLRFWHSGALVDSATYTLGEAVAGYIAGAIFAVIAAALLGPAPRAYAAVEPYILAIYSVPSVAIAPLFIIWFGVGVASKIVLAAYFVFFVVFMNVSAGIRSIPQGWIDGPRIMGASRWQVLTKIRFRAAMPHFILGLKIAVPEAIIGAIVGEFISSQKGIGYLILSSSARYDTASVFAAIFVLGVLVLIMSAAVRDVKHGARR